MRLRFHVAVGVITGAAAVALGQEQTDGHAAATLHERMYPPEMVDSQANAALEYIRIWDAVPLKDHIYLNEKYLRRRDDALTKDEREFAASHQELIGALMHAAGNPTCDWGVPRGITDPNDQNLFYPAHVHWMRSSSWLIATDGAVCVEEGRTVAAVERIVALIKMSGQTRTDRLLSSAVISAQWCREAVDLTGKMFEKGLVTPAVARPLLSALKGIPKDDPFGMATAIEGEEEKTLYLLRARYTGEHAGLRMMAEGPLWRITEAVIVSPAWTMNGDQVQRQLVGLEAYFKALVPLWRREDSEWKLEELRTEGFEGQFGAVWELAWKPSPIYYGILMGVRREIGGIVVRLERVVEPDAEGRGQK